MCATVDMEHHYRTPLMRSCYHGNLERAQVHINYGASVKARDAHGTTTQMFACNKHPECVQLILKHFDF